MMGYNTTFDPSSLGDSLIPHPYSLSMRCSTTPGPPKNHVSVAANQEVPVPDTGEEGSRQLLLPRTL